MKNNKKTLLVIMVLSAMSLMAADNPMIQVTTFEDQNGEDKCNPLMNVEMNKSTGEVVEMH